MSRSDWLLVALNSFLVAWASLGFASVDEGMLMVGALLAMAVGAVNLGVTYRRRKRQATSPHRDPVRLGAQADEMDVHAVLDFDARLEALERAQHDAVDAARWRALVESGQVTGPAADPTASRDTAPGSSIRNGQ